MRFLRGVSSDRWILSHIAVWIPTLQQNPYRWESKFEENRRNGMENLRNPYCWESKFEENRRNGSVSWTF